MAFARTIIIVALAIALAMLVWPAQGGPQQFDIPRDFVRGGGWHLPGSSPDGLDGGSGTMILIPADFIASRVPGYQTRDGSAPRDISVIFYVDPILGIPSIVGSSPCREKGRCMQRQGLCFVPHDQAPAMMGHLLRQCSPEPVTLQDYIGATLEADCPVCEAGHTTKLTAMLRGRNFAFEYSISGKNIALIEQLERVLATEIESWRVQ